MRIKKKKLRPDQIKKGYSIEETVDSRYLVKDGKRVSHFAIYDTERLIQYRCDQHIKGEI